MYQLYRRTPDGTWKKHSPMKTKREAAEAAGMCLYDNTPGITKHERGHFARKMEDVSCGTEEYHSGYIFRIDEV